jgi:hypothetical protein
MCIKDQQKITDISKTDADVLWQFLTKSNEQLYEIVKKKH